MTNLNVAERAILGTLIELNGDFPTAGPLNQLLEHAPESFDDMRHRQIACAIKDLKASGQAVHILAILERLNFNDSSQYLGEVANSGIPLESAITEADTVWKGYQQRRTAALFSEASDALTRNPELTRSVTKNVRDTLSRLDDENQKDGLPDIIDVSTLAESSPVLPEVLIEGVLHRGSKISLCGSSKAFKSWALFNMGLAISTGSDWLGFPTARSKVLYVNFEIQPPFMHQRFEALSCARLLAPDPHCFDLWNLRGFTAPHYVIIPKIIKRARESGYGFIIIDPSYKLFPVGSDENSATDVGAVMNSFETVTTQTGASVGFGAHFAKGNASAKESIDRVSGSGVFARDPDSIITFTKHEEEHCFTVEFTFRNFPPMEPFVVKWIYPQLVRQDDLDPSDLKKAAGGRPKSYEPEDLLALIQAEPLSSSEWESRAELKLKVSQASFFRLLKKLKDEKLVLKSPITDKWMPVRC